MNEALQIRQKLSKNEPYIYEPFVANTLINLSVLFQKPPANRVRSLDYLDQAIKIIHKYEKSPSVNKNLSVVKRILDDWQIDSEEYLKVRKIMSE